MEFLGAAIVITIIIAFIFYLRTLKATLMAITEQNRKMSPGSVYLNLIPIFSLGYHFYTVFKIKESLVAELNSKNIKDSGNGAIEIGIATCALVILSWIPSIGKLAGIAGIICWIIYWSKIANYKSLLLNTVERSGLLNTVERSGIYNIEFELKENGFESAEEKQIILIFNELSQKRKDLSLNGIVFKMEEDYKYKENVIREVIEKYKIDKNVVEFVEIKDPQSAAEISTLESQTPNKNSNQNAAILTPEKFFDPIKKIIKTSSELLQTNSARQFDVNMGLSDIKRNCEEALLALQKGFDIEGTPITSTEVGKGLRLLWSNFGIGWIDIVKSKMKASEHMALKRILNEIEKISQELENANPA